jgi:outer membrane immunogenic protein
VLPVQHWPENCGTAENRYIAKLAAGATFWRRSFGMFQGAGMIRTFGLAALSSVLLASVALAADLPSEKGAPAYVAPPPVFSWTGVYLGAQVGYEWGHTSPALDTPAGLISGAGFNDQGVLGGGHVGYNYELSGFGLGMGGFVVGVEGDVNGASYTGSNGYFGDTVFLRDRTEVDASIRGRVGIAFDRVLVYGTGGVAFGSIRNSVYLPGGPGEAHEIGRVGWTAGGGVEYAIDNNWSVRAEYRYTDYGHYDADYTTLFAPAAALVRYHDTDNRVQGGFSYKFDEAPPPAPPVVAKY